ncbi:hypothetical protein GQ43DRAFT_423169 [Delitschia confertaspora ATCC 74209]|uniref:Uncharacterized protein n=1 Tax=Delitschia confertaspora ATCC 74209 TaxID=1513339 RepID=A0A9P4JJ18_9PLEO|nr:hypothetical protein GQ43DRAFT_423169 [Delitschia confertaspora ATCC 74209]
MHTLTGAPDDTDTSLSSIIIGKPASHLAVLPTSQESLLSVSPSSGTGTAFRSFYSSSNLSQSTNADTEFTSPASSNGPSSQSQEFDSSQTTQKSSARKRDEHAQMFAPLVDTDIVPRTGVTASSPMSADFPVLTPGSKRTASGAVKSNGFIAECSPKTISEHRRTMSVDSAGAPVRVGELSAQLRTRLSYALVKVQNGWEKRSIGELEELPSQRGSLVPAPTPSTVLRCRRISSISEGSGPRIILPDRDTPSYNPSVEIPDESPKSNGPVLAPAAEIGPRRKRRSSAAHHPPPLLSSSQRKYYSDLSNFKTSPRTPTIGVNPRAGILRMPSQQAEKDAVDTLLFMSSPKNSNRVPHSSLDAQPSPLRTEMAAARRVVFANPHNGQPVPIRNVAEDIKLKSAEGKLTAFGSEYRAPVKVDRDRSRPAS